LGLSRAVAACFDDQRDARFVDHQLQQLVAQRLASLALARIFHRLTAKSVLRTKNLVKSSARGAAQTLAK
jgi:uncharacterized membrane protein